MTVFAFLSFFSMLTAGLALLALTIEIVASERASLVGDGSRAPRLIRGTLCAIAALALYWFTFGDEVAMALAIGLNAFGAGFVLSSARTAWISGRRQRTRAPTAATLH